MKSSLLRRAAGAVAVSALALTGVVVAGGAAPAQAAQTCATQTTLTIQSPRQVFGDFNAIRGEVDSFCPNGSPTVPVRGAVQIQRSLNGGASWATVATGSSSYVSYDGTTTPQNAHFRAVYVGGTYGTGENTSTFAGSSSPAGFVRVIRKVSYDWKRSRGGLTYAFKVKPKQSVKGMRVKFQVKKGKWRTSKRIKANNKGVVRGFFRASGNKTLYRMVLPAKRGFTGSKFKFGIRRY